MYKRSRQAVTQRFGPWLRSLREAKGHPLRAVAAASEMDQAHLSKAELGQRMITCAQGRAIAEFLGVDPTELEARRIVEKFLVDHADNPAVGMAIDLLHEDAANYGIGQ